MTRAALSVLVAGLSAAFGASKEGAHREIEGKSVAPVRMFTPLQLFEVSALKFTHSTIENTGTECTVVTGTLVSRLGSQDFDLTVEIDIVRVHGGGVENCGTAKAVVRNPVPNKAVKFQCLGPLAWDKCHNGKTHFASYNVRCSFTPHRFNPAEQGR